MTTVEGYYDEFLLAMSAAISCGTEEKDVRDEKRLVLEEGLAKLGEAIILNSGGEPLYVTNANFKLRSNDQEQSRQPLEDPLWKNLQQGVLSGTFKGEVIKMPKGARGLLVKWRIVGAAEYTMVNPTNGKRFELSDLPTMTKVEVQVRFYGTFSRISNWSIPFPIDVV